MSQTCPLFDPIEKGKEPENPYRHNPQNLIQALTFQLHDSVVNLYRVSAIKNPDSRLAAMLDAWEVVMTNVMSTDEALVDFINLRKFANKK